MTTPKETTAIAKRPIDKLKVMLNEDSIREQFRNALRDNADMFVASIIDLYGSDLNLQQCEAGAVIRECLKAATLKLPINRQLGFAWIIPYKIKGVAMPQFQMGYKGFIQLAMRSGHYRFLNAGVICEGVDVVEDELTGAVSFKGKATGPEVLGYFAYLELLNGFSKAIYWTADQVTAHGKRYSRAFAAESSPWQTDFNSMAMKTMLKQLLSKYGLLSIEMAAAIEQDYDEERAEDSYFQEVREKANVQTMPDVTVVSVQTPTDAGTTDPVQTRAPF